jgi:hypothetical protein
VEDAVARREGQRTLAERIVEKLDLPFEFRVIVPGPRSELRKRFESLRDAEILRR